MQILVGIFIGAAIGATGVGGGVLTAPLLTLMGMPLKESVGTALMFSAIAKVYAAILYLHRKQAHFGVLAYLLAGGIPGAVLGTLAMGSLFRNRSTHPVQAAVGIIIVVSAGLSLLRWARTSARESRPRILPLLSFPIGLEVGFSSAGAGALGTISLLHFTQLEPAVVVGTDLIFGLAVSAVAGSLHAVSGQWNSMVLFRLLIGGLPGTVVGSRLTAVAPAPIIRTVVLVWAMALGSAMAWQALRRLA